MEDSKQEVFHGTVIWFNKVGIGFISWEKDGIKQKDLFVHYSDLDQSGFKTLHKDQNVAFSIGLNHKGQPKAIAVKILDQK